MKLDFFGNEIKIGDTVAFMQRGYRTLKTSVVKTIAEQSCLIEHERFNAGGEQTRQFHEQIIKKIND